MTYDYVIIGSGFGGSVSALRLAQKGYSVLVVEKGKRYEDADFAKSNWQFWKYLWMPLIKAHGILQVSFLKGVAVFHGVGVGGGSLGYANVLEVPSDETFATPAWNEITKWGEVLRPHYETAKRMLGVARNPKLWPADDEVRNIAAERGRAQTFRATDVGVFFGEPGKTVEDPYFAGEGPARSGCLNCGACMVGCRHNAKNTLPKNYLYLAEKLGARILPESEVVSIQPNRDGYEIIAKRSTSWVKKTQKIQARKLVLSAGVLGTMKLLLRMRDVTRTLPKLSHKLGDRIRTNSEALLGSLARKSTINYAEGIAISAIYNHDANTRVEPVRYPAGSSLMRFLAGPLVSSHRGFLARLLKLLAWSVAHPIDLLRATILPGWAHNTTILLVMQNSDNRMRFRTGRSFYTLFRKGVVAEQEPGFEVKAEVAGSHALARDFARRTNGVALGSISENLLGLPSTAHILGGAPIAEDASCGVVNEKFEVHNYPGMFIVDASIMPANPGVNPSLTITALAEYAMSQIPAISRA